MATETQSQAVDYGRPPEDSDFLRRQRIRTVLSSSPHGRLTFDVLVNRVYESEYTGETDPVSHRRRVANALHYAHLPRLVALDAIDYDPIERCITLLSDP